MELEVAVIGLRKNSVALAADTGQSIRDVNADGVNTQPPDVRARHLLSETSRYAATRSEPTIDVDVASLMPDNLGGDDALPQVTPDMVEDWLRHAQLRAANLYYLAGDPSPAHRERALAEMTKALREALEEVRVVAEQLRRDAEVQRSKPRRDSPVREQTITPPRPLERD